MCVLFKKNIPGGGAVGIILSVVCRLFPWSNPENLGRHKQPMVSYRRCIRLVQDPVVLSYPLLAPSICLKLLTLYHFMYKSVSQFLLALRLVLRYRPPEVLGFETMRK